MEYTGQSGSDKDRQMMNSFESAPKAEKKEGDKDKKKKRSVFPFGLSDMDPGDDKQEKRGSIFESKKPEKDEPETKELDENQDVEKLAEDESHVVAEQYAELKGDELEQELAQVEPDSPEEASALANAVLIENLKEHLDQDEVVDEEMLDEILDETTSELELDEVEVPEEDREEQAEEDELVTTAPLSTSTRPPSTPPPHGTLPPTPPIPPTPPTLPGPPTPAFGGGSGGITTPNAVANTGNTLNTSPNVLDRRQRAADLLVGGVIGYLIGRRRGRIRTEERLLPVQEKLEGEVKDLQEKIASREEKIRKLAAQKVIEKPEAAPIIIEKLEKKLSPEKTEISQEKKPVVLERLGEVLVPRPETVEIPKKVETMTIPELLDIAQKIEAEGTTVRKMYEAGRLDSVGLKRVVGEYLAGRRVESVLYENLHRYESPEHLTAARPFSPQGSITRGGAAIGQARSSAGQPQAQIQNQARIPISLPSSGIQSTKKGQQSTTIAIILAVAIGILIALKILIG